MNVRQRQFRSLFVVPPSGGSKNRLKAARRTGFSLLELTLAMAATAMLALGLYTSMRVAIQARRSATAAVAPVRAATHAKDQHSNHHHSVLPPKGNYAGPFIGIRQTGTGTDADTLDFFSIGRDAEASELDRPWSEGIREITLLLDTGVTPPNLVRHVTRNLQPKVEVDPEVEVLCRGVRALSIRYFDGTDWQEEWDSTTMGDVLPTAVAITIELSDGNDTTTQPPNPANRVTRIVPLACAKLLSTTTTGGAQ